MTNEDQLRVAAQTIYDNMNSFRPRGGPPSVDISRAQSVLFNDEFVSGYVENGRMSVVRRFFCLFVAFDLAFTSLLWIISIMVTGENIYDALKKQILHYSISSSFFDIVVLALCRFIVLLLFYGWFRMKHWLIIALSTSGSCAFLILKVFVFNWMPPEESVIKVIIIVSSFVLAWGEAWFLDCRVLPQERHVETYLSVVNATLPSDRSPLIAPILTVGAPPSESIENFYSPYETIPNSDSEDDEQDMEYRRMGIECVRNAYDILESSDWKVEKVTNQNDTIRSVNKNKVGKIYRLTARIKYPAKLLLRELFHNIEEVPKWNPTLLESKIVRKIDNHTDISYQATASGPGGVVKSRDFVNLRCWRLYKNGKMVDSDDEQNNDEDEDKFSFNLNRDGASVSTTTDDEGFLNKDKSKERFKKSISESEVDQTDEQNSSSAFQTLSRSLGAKAFQGVNFENGEPPPLEDEFADAKEIDTKSVNEEDSCENMYISAAFSIDYTAIPRNPKYTRGENLVSCWAMRETRGKPDACIFEWLLCLDLKGYIPRYVLDNAYTTLMQEYMTYLRKHCNELRKRKKIKVPA